MFNANGGIGEPSAMTAYSGVKNKFIGYLYEN